MRILLIYLDQGAGPRNAALALQKAFSANAPEVDLHVGELCDMDESGNLRRVVQRHQEWRYRAAHDIRMSLLYRARFKALIAASKRKDVHHQRRLAQRIESVRPDAIVSVLQMPGQLVSRVLTESGNELPLAHVCTDFVVENRDALPRANLIAVANPSSVSALCGLGISSERIAVTGIPIDPAYEEPADPSGVCQSLRLDRQPSRPFILQIHSGSGDPIEERLRSLLQLTVPSDIVVVGVPELEAEAIEVRKDAPTGHRVRIMGRTGRVRELLAAADLVVTKAGALTAAQALASGCALVFMNTLPGIEQGNIEQLLEAGVATRVYEEAALPFELTRLLQDKERLDRMRDAAARVARPNAARVAVQKILQMVRQAKPQAMEHAEQA